jgi:hypothetical protein
VAGLGAGQFDTLNITGSATFSNNAVFHFIFDDFLPHSGDQFDFLFANLINGLDQVHFTYSGLGDGFDFRVHPESGGLQFVALNDATRQVPVPGTPLLLGMGLPLALWGARRRYQRPVKIESATP